MFTVHNYILGSATSASTANQLQTKGYEWYQGPGQQGKVRESKLSIRGCPLCIDENVQKNDGDEIY